MASAERWLISDGAKADAMALITTIMCVGIAGTSEASRLKGQARVGGYRFAEIRCVQYTRLEETVSNSGAQAAHVLRLLAQADF
jgi:hypothetical protein